MAALLLAVLALTADSRALLLVVGAVFGAACGCCLVSGLRETERLSSVDERGATVAVFYAPTYLGFAAPYTLGTLVNLGAGLRGAMLVAAAAGVVSLVVVSAATRVARPPAW